MHVKKGVTMVKLERTYDENGKRRLYSVNPKNGKELIDYYYKKGGIVIRTALPKDARCIAMSIGYDMEKISNAQRKPLSRVIFEQTRNIAEELKKFDQEDLDLVLTFEKKSSKANNFIGFGEIAFDRKDETTGYVVLHFISDERRRLYQDRVINGLASMCQKFLLFDKLVLLKERTYGFKRILFDADASLSK